MKSILEIIKTLEDFLGRREPSVDNGFALVSKEDFNTFVEIVYDIINAKWEPDPDGDFPISVRIIDRSFKEILPYTAVTYRHIDKKQYTKDILANLRTAVREVTLSFDLDEIDERFEKESGDKK